MNNEELVKEISELTISFMILVDRHTVGCVLAAMGIVLSRLEGKGLVKDKDEMFSLIKMSMDANSKLAKARKRIKEYEG